MNRYHAQQGATLIVALVMLVMLTILILSSSSLVTTDLQIASNVQGKKIVQFSAQQAIEQMLNSEANLTSPATHTFTINGTPVDVAMPSCLSLMPVGGYFMTSSSQASLAPVDTVWDLQTQTTDTVTSAATTVHQGVRVRMPVGSVCP